MKVTLEQYPFQISFPVHWGEMDAARHVNNLIYLRWSESARIAWFNSLNVSPDFSGIGPILGWQDCKYIFPVTYPDTVIAGMRVLEVLADRLILECGIFSERHQRIAAISKQHIIPYDYHTLKKVPLPKEWIAAK